MSEEACFVKMFKYFDTSDKGYVDLEEFCRVLEKTGMYYPQQQLYELFTSYDVDMSGTVDYRELAFALFGEYVKPTAQAKRPMPSQER
jgi:Ca2+-binding EF-hand superfamily protein